MGKRLTGFDYSRPFFYMVTIKCREGRLRALCESDQAEREWERS